MKHWIYLGIWVLLFSACTKTKVREDWYLKGGDVHLVLDWTEKRILLEDTVGMIFSGVITSEVNKEMVVQVHARLDKVNPLYIDKYPEEVQQDFVLWLEQPKKGELKAIINQIDTKPYFFTSELIQNTFEPYKQGRFLSEGEVKLFLKDTANYNTISRHDISILTTPSAKMSPDEVVKNEMTSYRKWMRGKYKLPANIKFVHMTDYLKDLNPSSGFITSEPTESLQLEYIFNASKNTDIALPLGSSVPIKAILINTGNLDQKQNFREYRRPQQLTLYFSKQYSGGLGATQASYNHEKMTILLTDEVKTHLIVFYKAISAKVILINVDSYYLGDKDEMALFDLVFYGDNV